FFFQAEDGIRDLIVTGVQTCALPISASKTRMAARGGRSDMLRYKYKLYRLPSLLLVAALQKRQKNGVSTQGENPMKLFHIALSRSEERRVGKESEEWHHT